MLRILRERHRSCSFDDFILQIGYQVAIHLHGIRGHLGRRQLWGDSGALAPDFQVIGGEVGGRFILLARLAVAVPTAKIPLNLESQKDQVGQNSTSNKIPTCTHLHRNHIVYDWT